MDEKTELEEKEAGNKKKKDPQRKKTEEIDIHEEPIMEPDNLPKGARFKGYRDIAREQILRHNGVPDLVDELEKV